ncbi:MAG: ABC transporter permease, partial [Armatimonadota bacterium]|nr:ABC transporter permease [Armatimonadota bacterium]
IVMVSIVEGARERVTKEFESIGSNLIFTLYMPERRASTGRSGVERGLTLADARAIERECPLVAAVCPNIDFRSTVRVGRRERYCQVMGVGEAANDVLNVEIARGRSVLPEDVANWNKVCVLGRKVAEELFPEADPIGREVEVRGVRLRVIGLLAPKGRALGNDRDDCVYIPLTTAHKQILGRDILSDITARAVAPHRVDEAADQIWAVLRRRHSNIEDFVVDTQESILASVDRILNLFAMVLGGIAGLALLVGGIGIMNIMLVSVTERTREIGLRKAVGARSGDILWQFLIEAMTLSGIGGSVGIAFGWSLSLAVGAVMKERMPTHVPPWSALFAFVFSAAVGIFFGAYPAWRAAGLSPIEALRHE